MNNLVLLSSLVEDPLVKEYCAIYKSNLKTLMDQEDSTMISSMTESLIKDIEWKP